MIHLIGLRHPLQTDADLDSEDWSLDVSPKDREAFQRYLKEMAESVKAAVIAEELSESRVQECGDKARSVAHWTADKLGIAHRFCDPDPAERRVLGLRCDRELNEYAEQLANKTGGDFKAIHAHEVRRGFPIRETFWLARLAQFCPNDRSILFLCGADHIDSFTKLLHFSGVDFKVLCRDWGLTLYSPKLLD